jgi:hypothetical protein
LVCNFIIHPFGVAFSSRLQWTETLLVPRRFSFTAAGSFFESGAGWHSLKAMGFFEDARIVALLAARSERFLAPAEAALLSGACGSRIAGRVRW